LIAAILPPHQHPRETIPDDSACLEPGKWNHFRHGKGFTSPYSNTTLKNKIQALRGRPVSTNPESAEI
jgi:hypothetical protein